VAKKIALKTVFLSASIPLPHRDPRYFETVDTIAVRDSIRALVSAVVPVGRLIFGGHPAITPLIRLIIRAMNRATSEHIVVYQSRYFEKQLTPEIEEFGDVRFTEAVSNDREKSLALMRTRMISDHNFDAAIFIGGMEGVETEFDLFKEIHPRKPVFPIASTGAAALAIFQNQDFQRRELADDLLYLSLFRRLLEIKS
jgi:SLOG cluster3 family